MYINNAIEYMIKNYHRFKIAKKIRIPLLQGLNYKLISYLEYRELKKIKNENLFLNTSLRNKKIIVSLTSFPARIDMVHMTIRSIFNQTLKPDMIILWLSDEEFVERIIPKELQVMTEIGLNIEWCKNIKSHKKYYYTMLKYPEDIVVTFDDDIIYPENYLENLYKKYLKYEDCIICNQGHKMLFDDENGFLDYKKWETPLFYGVKKPEKYLMPVGCGGVLYPPGSLHDEVFNLESMRETALLVDDLWLKFMGLKKGTLVVRTCIFERPLTCVPGSQKVHLGETNCLKGNNNSALKKLIKKYPEVVEGEN